MCTAGLSAALKEAHFDAVAFDHKRIPGAKTTIQVADLCSEPGFSLAKKLLLHPRCVGCFAAPVCGTASRAREIACVSGPPPLRSEEEPDGLANLSPSGRLRVQKANTLYHAISDLVLVAASRGLVVVLENPRRSLYWRASAFMRIQHLFSFTFPKLRLWLAKGQVDRTGLHLTTPAIHRHQSCLSRYRLPGNSP